MNTQRLKDLSSEVTRRGWVTFAAICALAMILVALGSYAVFSGMAGQWFAKKDSPQQSGGELDQFIDGATGKIFTKDPVDGNVYANDRQGASAYVGATQEVQVAVVIDETQYDIEGTQNVSCGRLAFVTARVAGPSILTNTLRELFADRIVTDFMPGNIIPSYHPNLKFAKATVENGAAKIYLTGSFSGERNGFCDANLAITQIAETAKGFATVETVEIFQGSHKIYSSGE